MRTPGSVLLITIVTFVFLGCSQPANQTQTPSATTTSSPNATSSAADQLGAMRPVYIEHCQKCHGETGAGGRVEVQGKTLRVPSLTGDHAKKPSDEKLAEKIQNGDEGMPAFKDKLTPEQIKDMVRFIRAEFQSANTRLYQTPFTIYYNEPVHP